MDDLNRRSRMYLSTLRVFYFHKTTMIQHQHVSLSSSQCCTQVRRASKPLWMHQNTVEYIVSAIETICTTQDMVQVLQKLSALQKNNNMAGLIRTIEKVVDWFQPLVSPVLMPVLIHVSYCSFHYLQYQRQKF